MFGSLLSTATKIINAPIRAAEDTIASVSGDEEMPEQERIASKPLSKLADAFKDADE